MQGCTRLEARLLDAMHVVEWHGKARSIEHGRLVHVVPRTSDAILDELLIKIAPPLASLGASEVGKHRWARPHDADILAPVSGLHKMISRMAGVIRRVSLIRQAGDVQVRNRDQVKVLLAKVGDKPRKIREPG